MKVKGIILITVGMLGTISVCMFDVIAGKPINDVTGLKSILALILCGLLIVIGIRFLYRFKPKKVV